VVSRPIEGRFTGARLTDLEGSVRGMILFYPNCRTGKHYLWKIHMRLPQIVSRGKSMGKPLEKPLPIHLDHPGRKRARLGALVIPCLLFSRTNGYENM
jgi:hypothetical protein